MTQIFVFGDSITYGAWDIEGGWVARLRKFLDKKNLSKNNYYIIYNLGISGDTSELVLKRIKSEIENRLNDTDKTEKVIIIIDIGSNDSGFIKGKNQNFVKIDKFKKNIYEIIKISEKYSKTIIFNGLIPIDDSKTNPVPWNTDFSYSNSSIKEYDNILKQVCIEKNVKFIDQFSELSKINYKNLLEDGVHPNSRGHEKMFEIIKKNLIDWRIIEK